MLLADRLQRVQGAFDVADLCGQGVYGLHGAIQLLAASHQRVHALWEPKCKAGDEKAAAKSQVERNDGNITRNINYAGLSTVALM